MSAVERELEAIIRREADGVRPPEGAKARGWERLVAALPEDGGGPDDDGGPGDGSAPATGPVLKAVPPLKAVPLLKVVPLAVLLVVGGALVPWGMGGGPPVVADSLPGAPEPAPAVLFGAPVHIPFAPEPSAAPPIAVREASTGESGVSAPARTTPRPRPRADDGEDNFAGELSLLAAGQAAIQRGELREGIALLRSHKQRFPRGHFAQERDALIAIARCEGGQSRAREEGQRFLQANAESIHAERVRTACELEENEK